VEYALESVNHAGTCIGLHTENGILLASEKKIMSKVDLDCMIYSLKS